MARIKFSNEHVNRVFENKSFSEFNDLMTSCALNTLETFDGKTKAEAEEEIRNIFFEVLNLQKGAKRKEIRQAMRRNRVAMFEVTEELIPNLLKLGWQDNPFFKDYVEYKSYADGDTNEYYVEDETILTVSEVSGNHHDLQRQALGEGSTFSVKTSWYGVKVYAEFELFMAGKVDWAKLVQKIYEGYDKKINTMLYAAVMTADQAVKPAGRFTKTAAISTATTQAQKDTIKETIVELVDDLQTITGEEVVLMGTKTALSKLDGLGDSTWISDAMKQERHTTGRIGLFEGIRKVEIPQGYADGTTNFAPADRLVDNAKILVMPTGDNKFIKMFDEGDAQVKEVTDGNTNLDKTIEYEYQQKMGIATVINKKFGSITLS